MAASRIPTQLESPLAARVAAVLREAGVGQGDRLCVALSGGVDSVVLLDVLAGLRSTSGFSLSASHVHHGLSPHAGQWLDHCAALCRQLDVSFTPLWVAVRRDHPDGLEAAARAARHAALAGVATDWLVFGHHRDDQAETVLFRLLRGAGVRGAAAMRAIELGLLRPLLGASRAEILSWARARDLAWVEDESNAELRHARNFLRHEVLPRIKSVFPAAPAMLARAAENFSEADGLLADLAAIDAAACGGQRLCIDALRRLPEARMRNLIRARIQALGLETPPRARLMEAVRQLRASEATALYLPLGAAACCLHRGTLRIEAALGEAPCAVVWRGETELPWGDGRVRLVEAFGAGVSVASLRVASEVLFDRRREGLRMCNAAGRPRHSFKNLCQEAGVPAWLRGHLPVLYIDGEPAWIAGVGIAPHLACAADEPGLQPEWLRG